MKIGVSQCLLGVHCTYKGTHNLVPVLKQMYDDGLVVSVCPEVLGGLPIPRPPAEIISQNPLYVQNINGEDVTSYYVEGSKKALEIFLNEGVDVAILKYSSPSCGCDGVYDGSFSHTRIDGQGVFAKMLNEHGICVFHDKQIKEFLKYIGKEDEYGKYFKD